MRAEHLAQLVLKQVERGVVAAYCLAACDVYTGGHAVADVDDTLAEGAHMQVDAVGLLGVVYKDRHIVGRDDTTVADLAAALTVEGCAVENESEITLGNFLAKHIVGDYRHDLCVGHIFGVSGEFRLGQTAQQILLRGIPAADVAACGTGAVALLEHKSLKALVVHLKPRLLCDLAREVDGEAVGVVELEHAVARESGCVFFLGVGDHAGENIKPRVDGGVEALLFDRDDLHDIVTLCVKLGIRLVVFADRNGKNVGEELTVYAEQLAVTGGAADYAAQHVAASLVRGDNAVGDHEHRALDVVGYNADGDIVVLVGAVGLARDLAHLVKYLAYGIDLKHIVHALHYAREAFKTHAGVDVFLLQLGVIAVTVVVEL
ncbi:putative uncharacterized protein [Anaerotruncus sp. CAG:390]|nr:putative uncharacterized protein [Anaerotruncus sp. CAG:390]